ncbi:hypothetical protein BDZ45DRAFT_672961 [Acephala macrosclerotiorum]|nr:hypothetical protein BDZ45DRAFT_672961 [Acephala macrosclerotiorum]
MQTNGTQKQLQIPSPFPISWLRSSYHAPKRTLARSSPGIRQRTLFPLIHPQKQNRQNLQLHKPHQSF